MRSPDDCRDLPHLLANVTRGAAIADLHDRLMEVLTDPALRSQRLHAVRGRLMPLLAEIGQRARAIGQEPGL